MLAGQRQVPGFAQAHANKDCIEILLEISEGNIAADLRLLPELDAKSANGLDFAKRVFGAQFIGSDSVGVEAAWLVISVENGDAIAHLSQVGSAGERRRP